MVFLGVLLMPVVEIQSLNAQQRPDSQAGTTVANRMSNTELPLAQALKPHNRPLLLRLVPRQLPLLSLLLATPTGPDLLAHEALNQPSLPQMESAQVLVVQFRSQDHWQIRQPMMRILMITRISTKCRASTSHRRSPSTVTGFLPSRSTPYSLKT